MGLWLRDRGVPSVTPVAQGMRREHREQGPEGGRAGGTLLCLRYLLRMVAWCTGNRGLRDASGHKRHGFQVQPSL